MNGGFTALAALALVVTLQPLALTTSPGPSREPTGDADRSSITVQHAVGHVLAAWEAGRGRPDGRDLAVTHSALWSSWLSARTDPLSVAMPEPVTVAEQPAVRVRAPPAPPQH